MVELVTAISLLAVVVLAVGILMVSSQKNWNVLYGRVYRQEAIDSPAARAVFEAICRKSSHSKAVLNNNKTSLELYYWNPGSNSSTPENYARFYLSGTNLRVEQGKNKPGEWIPDTNSPAESIHIAAKVKSVQFDTVGASVQMVVNYSDTKLAPVVYSAIRKNL